MHSTKPINCAFNEDPLASCNIDRVMWVIHASVSIRKIIHVIKLRFKSQIKTLTQLDSYHILTRDMLPIKL